MTKKFLQRFLAGECEAKDILEAMEGWDDSPTRFTSLSDWLGMTDTQYEAWLRDPEILEKWRSGKLRYRQ